MATSMPSKRSPRIHILPGTRFGWWGVGCAVLGIALTMAWQITPLGGWPGFAAQVAGGVLALVAIIKERDRAFAVFIAVLAMLFVIWFIAVELLSLAGILPEH